MAVPLALLSQLGSLGVQAAGDVTANQISNEATQAALETQLLGQTFGENLLQQSIDSQQPFIDAGTAALPLAEIARQGGQEFRETPIFQQREASGISELLNSIQGDDLSGFARDRFDTGLAVSEQDQNKARLNDLINIGLGASGTAGQQGNILANTATTGALRRGNLGSSGAQTSFEQRQNAINNQIEGLSGLPSFLAATQQGA